MFKLIDVKKQETVVEMSALDDSLANEDAAAGRAW